MCLKIIKILSYILVVALIFGTFSFNALAKDDKPSSWAGEFINEAINNKLVPKSLQGKYTQAITRAEFCALAVTLFELLRGKITVTITGTTENTDLNLFTDTKDENVIKMATLGVVSGVGNKKFDPDGLLTREQVAVILSKLAEKIGKPFPEGQKVNFADNNAISSWALDAIGQMQAEGIMNGIVKNNFEPQDFFTREQSIITILRTYYYILIIKKFTEEEFKAETEKLVKLINNERAKKGSPALKLNNNLVESAKIRAKELNEIYSHTRPDGTCAHEYAKKTIPNAWWGGECINNAMIRKDGFTVMNMKSNKSVDLSSSLAESIMYSWANSEEHYKAIVNNIYTSVGIGFYQKENKILVSLLLVAKK